MSRLVTTVAVLIAATVGVTHATVVAPVSFVRSVTEAALIVRGRVTDAPRVELATRCRDGRSRSPSTVCSKARPRLRHRARAGRTIGRYRYVMVGAPTFTQSEQRRSLLKRGSDNALRPDRPVAWASIALKPMPGTGQPVIARARASRRRRRRRRPGRARRHAPPADLGVGVRVARAARHRGAGPGRSSDEAPRRAPASCRHRRRRRSRPAARAYLKIRRPGRQPGGPAQVDAACRSATSSRTATSPASPRRSCRRRVAARSRRGATSRPRSSRRSSRASSNADPVDERRRHGDRLSVRAPTSIARSARRRTPSTTSPARSSSPTSF